MPRGFSIPLEEIGDGIVLLPGAHAARVWRAEQADQDPSFLSGRQVLAWREWTGALWAQLLLGGSEGRILLNRLQEEHLWAEIIGADRTGSPLTPGSIPELARIARSGLARAAQYRIVSQLRSAADTVDSRRFAQWTELFLRRCEREQFLPAALLEQTLGEHLRSRTLACPPALNLVGFQTQTPAQCGFLDELERAGTLVRNVPVPPSSPVADARLAATTSDEAEELRIAVRLIARHASMGTADTFALITPEPERHQSLLEPLFRELLAPELGSVTADLSSTPWHFVAQPVLGGVPAVRAALDLLRWTLDPLPLERIDQLLTSPSFQHEVSLEERSRCQALLHRFAPLRPVASLPDALNSLQGAQRPVRLPMLRRLQQAAERARLDGGRRPHADWAEQARQLLRVAGWPGDRALLAAEFQAVEAWEGLLDRLATLGVHQARTDFRAFLELVTAELNQQASSSPYPNAPLQVLSLAETEGLRFDLAVVLSASENFLPGAEGRHSLLPQSLQRSLGVGEPARDAARSLEALEALTRRSGRIFLLAAPSGEGGAMQLSPFAGALQFAIRQPADLLPLEPPRQPAALDILQDTAATLPPLGSPTVPKGVEMLRLQAACGFRAFAALRLGAEEAPTSGLGLDARQAGKVLHDALHFIWQQLGSHDALSAMPLEARRGLTMEAAGGALAPFRTPSNAADPWADSYLDVLTRRFASLLLSWLDQELLRSPFRVAAVETERKLVLGPVELRFRLDRIDEVEGGLALIDYKSSSSLARSQWLEERPDAPQLPAYALTFDNPAELRGVAFARVRPGQKEAGWISLSDASGTFPRRGGEVLDMAAQVEEWRSSLTALAKSFAAGDARVDPKSYPQTCQYCAFRALCRLDPATLLAQAQEDEAGDEEQPGG